MNHNGYFKQGECIEASGEKIGIVSKANETTFWMQRLIYFDSKYHLCPDESAYSNEAIHYQDKYWIKTVEAPADCIYLAVKPLTI